MNRSHFTGTLTTVVAACFLPAATAVGLGFVLNPWLNRVFPKTRRSHPHCRDHSYPNCGDLFRTPKILPPASTPVVKSQ